MIRKLAITTAVVMLGLLTALPVSAQNDPRQWDPPDGFPIRAGYHTEWFWGIEGRYAGNPQGEVAIVWSDCRWSDSKFGDRAIYVQILDVNNRFKFPEGGKLVADGYNRQEDPGVWPANDGGWFIAWEDFDHDSSGNIYATKIDANGNRLWAVDEPRGIPICTLIGAQADVRIVEDGNGGCIIAWLDARGGDTGDLYAQRVTRDGRVAWQVNGIPIVVRAGPQTNHTADTDGAGGMIIGWKDGVLIGNPNIWAQRVSPNGELLWGQGEGVVICGHAAQQESPKMCPDGSGGAFFTWVDDRNQQTGKDIYAQRVDENGNLLWDEEGEPLVTVAGEQASNRIVASFSGEAIVSWEDKRDDGLTTDIYAMRISGVNGVNKLWNPSTGVPVSVVGDCNQTASRLYPDAQGGAYFVWEDSRNGGPPNTEIWGQRLNRQDGSAVWQQNGVFIDTLNRHNNAPVVRRTADGGAIVVWGVGINGNQGIHYQLMRTNGNRAFDIPPPVVTGIPGIGINPQSVLVDDRVFATTWSDGRYSDVIGQVPFVQFTEYIPADSQPNFYLEEGGIPALVGTIGGGINQSIVPDGSGGVIVTWQDQRLDQFYSIHSQKITPNGERRWGDSGARAAEGEFEQLEPKSCSDGAGGVIMAWKSRSGGYTNIFMQRLDSNGNPLWGDAGIQMTDVTRVLTMQDLIPDGEGGAVLFYRITQRETDDDLHLIRVNDDGEQVWDDEEDPAGIAVCVEYEQQNDGRIVKMHEPYGFAMVWTDKRHSEPGRPLSLIFAQVITSEGEFTFSENGEPVCDLEYSQSFPDLAVDNHNNLWITWEDHRWSGIERRGKDIYMQKIKPRLENNRIIPFFPADGSLVCGDTTNQLAPKVAFDEYGGAFIVWEDLRSGTDWSDIYGAHFDPTGRLYGAWNEWGNPISTAYHRQEMPHIFMLDDWGGFGAAVVWIDKRATGKDELFNIYSQVLNDGERSVPDPGADLPPLHFSLDAVHPNPFNSTALVKFSNRFAGKFDLSLHDIQGRLVNQIAADWYPAGAHNVVIDAGNMASGTYLIRLSQGTVNVERSIQLIK